MKFGAILLHNLLQKLYLEIGDSLINRGHEFICYTPEGQPPDSYTTKCTIKSLDQFYQTLFDVVMTSDIEFVEHLKNARANQKIFYVMRKDKALKKIVQNKDIIFFANSNNTFKYIYRKSGNKPFKAYIDNNSTLFPKNFGTLKNPFSVLEKGYHQIKNFYYNNDSERKRANEEQRENKGLNKNIIADKILSVCETKGPSRIYQNEWPYNINIYKNNRLKNKNVNLNKELPAGIYVLAYHSITNPKTAPEWDKAFIEASTSTDNFKEHLKWLKENATPVTLSDIPNILQTEQLKRPFFAITFDDGYANIKNEALQIMNEFGITGTVFINSDFADGDDYFSMVKLSELIRRGQLEKVKKEFKKTFGVSIKKTRHLFRAIKKSPQYFKMLSMIDDLTKNLLHEKVHLDWDDLKLLVANGWSIGNHTASHVSLAVCTYDQQKDEIEKVIAKCQKNSVPLIPWLAFPYGSPEYVNHSTLHWLYNNPQYHGIFANGGVNKKYNRTELMRIGIGDLSIDEFKETLYRSAYRTGE